MDITYTTHEKNELLEHLKTSRQGLFSAVEGLTEAQSNFKPSADAWSVANVVEHLAIVEDVVALRLEELPTAPEGDGTKFDEPDAVLIQKIMDRSLKVKAPERGEPKGNSLKHSLDRLSTRREQIVGYLHSAPADFRKHAMPHPVFGQLDGHQWLLALAAHCARHVEQIKETKTNPNFPR